MNTDFVRPSWLTLVLGIVTLITFLASLPAGPGLMHPYPVTYERAVAPSASMPAGDTAAQVDIQTYNGTPAVTDTREFLKTSYSAQMETRSVRPLERRVETTVKGYKGRIDSSSVGEESVYVSFVVPQDTFDEFRTELESLVADPFIKVDISSENRLGEKVSIEDQQKQASSTLINYQSSRDSLTTTHKGRLASLQASLSEAQANDSNDASYFQAQIDAENSTYISKLASLDASIKQIKDWQAGLGNTTDKFMANIATVNGSVSLRHINMWEVVQGYLPGFWIPGIFALLTLLSYLWDRRRAGHGLLT